MNTWAYLACGGAAIGAGVVNALAGGGTLISFPVMTALGVPTKVANATNMVSLLPGYVSGTHAQRKELTGVGATMRPQLIIAGLGGLLGSFLLVVSSEAAFRQIVPFLILAACLMLAVQTYLRSWLFGIAGDRHRYRGLELGAIAVTALYGGYFGAGLGIMLMAVLGLFSDRSLTTVNAVKQSLSIVISLCAAAFLVVKGNLDWTIVAVMAPGSLLGGGVGGRLAGIVPATGLRVVVVGFGVVVAVAYLFR